ncbi:MAG: hypothetical protein NWP36_01805, partial [Paracoccaceae bacterium]|nr:hypothetical protein [Paracoccaceae bacterium]
QTQGAGRSFSKIRVGLRFDLGKVGSIVLLGAIPCEFGAFLPAGSCPVTWLCLIRDKNSKDFPCLI